MAVTARSLAGRSELGLTLVAGHDGADRSITWAHAIELADPAPYLAGGELVMATGINVGRTYAAQRKYVSRLSQAGTSALAIDTGTTFADVPEGLIRAGNEFRMPVLKVPASTPFIAITRAVIDELTADQLRSVQHVVDQQELLARKTLAAGTPGVVEALAQCLSAAVMVMGPDGRLLAARGPDVDRVMAVGEDMVGRARSGHRSSSRVLAHDGGYCMLQLLKVARTVRGYLLVGSADPLTALQRLLVAHAVSLISIDLEKPARVVDAEQRLRSVVTQDLVANPTRADAGVLRYFGFEPTSEVSLLVITGVGPLMTAEHEANRALGKSDPYLLFSLDDEVVVVVDARSREHLVCVHRDVQKALGRPLRAGISSTAALPAAPMLLEQARTAARAAADRPVCFDDLGIFATVLGGRSVAELRLIAAPLQSLAADRNAVENSLVDTLKAFLTCNGQMEPAATALGIHRHTLRNRLQRIARLTGADLHTADARAQLWIALKAREMLSIRTGSASSAEVGH